MSNSSVVLRNANAVFNEGLEFARYLDDAFEGFIHALLGRQFAEIVATAFSVRGHIFSYENTIFAEYDGAIAGMICGFAATQQHDLSLRSLKNVAGRCVARRVGVSLLAVRLRLLGSHPDGDFYIQALAVHSDLRGRGIGAALMEHAEERARSCGSTRLSLDVVARNSGARRFYGRRGLRVEPGWRETLRVPRFVVRMTKPLQ